MHPSEIQTLYEYTNWATERILTTAAALTSEQWLTPGTAGRGSTRDTLVHMVNGQRNWLAVWNGSPDRAPSPVPGMAPEDYPNAPALQAAWSAVHGATLQFIEGLTEDALMRDFQRTLGSGQQVTLPLWQMMVHIVNHGTQHRSEAAAMLTAFEHSPGELDIVRYLAPPIR